MKKFILAVLVCILSVSLYSQERVNDDLGEIIGTSKSIQGFNKWHKRDGVWESSSYSPRYGIQMVQIRYKETVNIYIVVFFTRRSNTRSFDYPYNYYIINKLALYKIQEEDYINMINLGSNEKITVNMESPLIVNEPKDIPQIIHKSNQENFKSGGRFFMIFQNYTNKDGVSVVRFSPNILDPRRNFLSFDYETEYIEYSGSIKDFKIIKLNND